MGERERENWWSIGKCERVFFPCYLFHTMPCALKEKWHRKEHIIIIIIIIATACCTVSCPAGSMAESGQCVLCPLGQYQDQSASTSCKPCPDDLAWDIIGAYDVTLCRCE